MNSIGIAVLLAGLFTIPAALIDVSLRASRREQVILPWRLWACFTPKFLLYFIIVLGMNAISAWAIAAYASMLFPDSHQQIGNAAPILYAAIAVFAFEGVASNITVLFLNNSLPLFQRWVEYARDLAVSAAIARQAQLEGQDRDRTARVLVQFPDDEFDSYCLERLGSEKVDKLKNDTSGTEADVKLYIALELAKNDLSAAKAIVKEREKRGRGVPQ